MIPQTTISTLFPYTTLFRSTAKNITEKVAIEFENKCITFGELDQTSNCVADAYRSLEVLKGDRVAHFASTSPGLIFSDRKSTRLNSSHRCISYAVFCLKKKN